MIGKMLAHYEILARLGAGGMGEVYRARDTKLDRDVALKVLPPEMGADPDRRQRFEREAKAIAALNHPNIVTVYSVEEADGTVFLTMELVEGRTLGQLLAGGALALGRLFDIAIPLADAVHAAHQKGITHRDLKPANIMLDPSERVKVLDFGLAKLRVEPLGDEARTIAVDEPATEEGKILGTLAYMAPEQAEGKLVDHRSDVFALGVLLYEMSTGRRPFQGDTTASTLAAILRDTPPPVVSLRDGLPRHLDRIIRRCLDKDPARRFQSAADLRVEIENLKSEIDSGDLSEIVSPPPLPHSAEPSGSRSAEVRAAGTDAGRDTGSSTGIWVRVRRARIVRLLVIYVAVCAGVLLVADLMTVHVGLPDWFLPGAALLLAIGLPILVATAYVQSRTRVRHWLSWRKAIGGGVLALGFWGVVVTGYLVMRSQGIGPAASLVSAGVLEERSRVLIADFENHTEDPLLGEAVKEAFSVDLSQSPVVTVVGANGVSRVLQRMGMDPDTELDEATAREVAVRDGIPIIVTGRINPAGTGYVFSVRLLEARNGEALTAIRETAGSDEELIGAIDALSRTLRERIGESIKSTRASTPLAQVTTPSLAALQKYTLANRIADTGEDVERAIGLLEEAVAIDTTFAMAYRKLGVLINNADLDGLRAREALIKAYRYRDRLTERERYLTMAMYYNAVTFETDKAIDAYEHLIEIDQDDDWALNNLALIYNGRGEYEKALPLIEHATAIDTSVINLGNLAMAQIRTGDFAAARQTIDRYTASFGEGRSFLPAALAIVQGDYETAESAIRHAREVSGPETIQGRRMTRGLALIAATRGKIEESRRLRDELRAAYEANGQIDRYIEIASDLALLYATFGERERGRDILEDALARHPLEALEPWDVPHATLAWYYALVGEAAPARAHLEGYREQVTAGQRPWDSSEYGLEGWIAMGEERHEDALAHFQRWLHEDRTPFIVFFSLAEAYDRVQQPDSARVHYERFLTERNPFRPGADENWRASALVRLGELHEEAADPERAASYYREFVELWKDADPALQPRVRTIERRLEGLRSGG